MSWPVARRMTTIISYTLLAGSGSISLICGILADWPDAIAIFMYAVIAIIVLEFMLLFPGWLPLKAPYDKRYVRWLFAFTWIVGLLSFASYAFIWHFLNYAMGLMLIGGLALTVMENLVDKPLDPSVKLLEPPAKENCE